MSDQTQSDFSVDRYRQILETAPDAMIVVGTNGVILFANGQTEKMFGYARSDLIGKPLEVLVPQRFRRTHQGHVSRYFGRPELRSMGSGLDLFGLRADGTEIAIEVSLSPVKTEEGVLVSAAIRDITDRKRIEATATLNAQRLASAVESIQDAFALFDHDDRLVLCNSVYRRLIGEALPGPLVGRSYQELLAAWIDDIDFPDEESRETFRRERLATRRAEQTSAFDIRMRDGRSLRVSDRRTAEGGIVKTIWDLTDDVHREEELREARAMSDAASAAKSDFLSSMSHELRTPLNAILGFAQLLQRDKKEPLSPRHLDRVDHILKGGEHLLRLIDDILDLSRIESGGISMSIEPVSLRDVFEEVIRALEPMASKQGIRIHHEPLSSNLGSVAADRTRLVQILMNLGSNAIKYNRPDGDVTFAVSTPLPEVVRVTVTDTGVGIPLDKQSIIFQPFQRAGQETGPIEGTGIGLVITRRLARLMGGDVGFASAAGKGSAFWVDIPAHASDSAETKGRSAFEPTRTKLAPEGHRLILYVEDNPANVVFMKDLMSTFDDVELLTAPTAELGIELARTKKPEVVIMDINLPGMSGIDALRALRSSPETEKIPVIALSAAASERDQQRGIQAGFYRYLTKPVKVDEFVAALDSLLSR